jgi:hypothetical protein
MLLIAGPTMAMCPDCAAKRGLEAGHSNVAADVAAQVLEIAKVQTLYIEM